MDLESDPDSPLLIQNNFYALDDGKLDDLIRSKISQTGIGGAIDGETATNAVDAVEVRESAPETTGSDTV